MATRAEDTGSQPRAQHAAQPRPRLVYEAMAEAFVAEGVDTHFLLMGHGQMLWAVTLAQMQGMKTVTTRHEHAAVTMATGYHFATGKVGVASVTCGPGFTQIMTALTSAAQAQVPLVVLAADSPINSRWYNQMVEQAPLAGATGSRFIAAHSPKMMHNYVQEAFYTAQFERRPVVISIPYDLMSQPMPAVGAYIPSSEVLPQMQPMPANVRDVEDLADRLAKAKRPIVLAGRGVLRSGAREAVEALAEESGALLATSLPARGMFDHNPFSVGIAGGFSGDIAAEMFGQADLVVAIGASLTYYTADAGRLYPDAFVVQMDEHPVGLRHGMRAADVYVRSDARLGAEAVTQALKGRKKSATFRTDELARRIKETPADSAHFDVEPGLLDPRDVVAEIDRVIPKDWEVVAGTGHSSYFYSHLKGRDPGKHHILREFGAIGSSLSLAIGVAAAKGDGKVVILDGDGGMMMHIQELESIQRQGISLLIVVFNDGGFGSEIHKLRLLNMPGDLAVFGRPDFASIAKGFGIKGATVTETQQLASLFGDYDAAGPATVWDVHISDKVTAPRARRTPV